MSPKTIEETFKKGENCGTALQSNFPISKFQGSI